MDSPKGDQPPFAFGPYEADLRAGELRKGNTRIKIQDLPLRLLAMLVEKPGEVLTRAELQKRLWPGDTFVDFEDGLHTAVRKLREALCDDPEKPRYIETVPRRGYRFIAELKTRDDRNRASLSQTAHREGTVSSEPSAAENSPAAARSKPQGTARTSWKLWVSLAVAAAALLALVTMWLLGQHSAFSFNATDSVLVADFENETGDPRFDQALQTAFEVSLEQSRNANVFSRLRIPEVLRRMGRPANDRITPALGREICQRENIRGLIACSITRSGQEYALTAELIDPQNGSTLRSYTERTHGEGAVLDALDSLSQKIRADLGESLYQIHTADRPLPEVTTSSLEALEDYADGTLLWRQAKFHEALALLRAAVAADPGFAMAHGALGSAYCSYIYNQQSLGKQEYQQALANSDRATDRERFILRTHFADDMNHVDEAASLYQLYLSQYPDDWVMLNDYAHLLRMHGRAPEAIKQYEQILRVAPNDATTYVEMATAYSDLGDFPNALQAYSRAFGLEPALLTAGDTNREYGAALVDDGQPQKAEQVFSALLAKPETRENGLRSLALLDLYHGRYAHAQLEFEDALAIDNGEHSAFSAARVHYMLALIAGGEGNTGKQVAELDAVMPSFKYIGPKVAFGALIGQAYARAGAVSKAENILTVITPLADAKNIQQTKYLHLLQAEITLARGNPERALELVSPPAPGDEKSITVLLIEFMAHAYQSTGKVDFAIQWYEKLLAAAPGWVTWEPEERCVEAHYFLAEDYLTEGNRERAHATLGVLLNLWSNADTNLPLRKQALQLNARIAK